MSPIHARRETLGGNMAAMLSRTDRPATADSGAAESQVYRPPTRQCPEQYVYRCSAADGTPLTVRPIRAEDEAAVVAFHKTLSDRSVYFRYGGTLKLSRRT